MTTPTLELHLRAEGVDQVKNLTAALSALNAQVGNLGKAKTALSQLKEIATDLRGMREELRKGLGEIKSTLADGVKSGFAAAAVASTQGARELQRNFDQAMKGVIDTVQKRNEEVAKKLTEVNAGTQAKMADSGRKAGKAYADGVQDEIAKVRLSISVPLAGGAKAGISIPGLTNLGRLMEETAKVQAAPAARKAADEVHRAFVDAMRAKSASNISPETLLGLPSRDSMKSMGVQIASQMRAGIAAENARAKSATNVPPETLLGLPSRDSMKTMGAQIAAQLREGVKIESLRAKSASNVDPRTLLGLPSTAEMKRVSNQLRLEMQEIQNIRAQVAAATNSSRLPFTSIAGGSRGTVYNPASTAQLDDTITKAPKASSALKILANQMNDTHSAARGLASGFGLLWLTWGNLLPLLAGAAISNAFVQTVRLGADVQNTFKQIEVLAGESAESVGVLNTKMLEMARNSQFGPTEIAKAMKTLSLAGLSAKEVFASVQDVINFATAGDTSIEKASDVMTTVATAFNVAAQNYSYVGDTIAKAAAESKSSVESMGEAFKTASVIHQQYGVSLEDTAVGLSLLANAGIQGTAAGTALRNMYVDLGGRTPKVTKALKELGVEAIDPLTGKMKEQAVIFKQLMESLATRTPTAQYKFMQDIFSERGGKEAIAILNALKQTAEETGTGVANAYQELSVKIQEAAGFTAIAAAQMALTPLNQMKSVTSALQATLVETFEAMQPTILDLSTRLKEAFASEEFKSAVRALIELVGTFLTFVAEHARGLVQLLAGYMAFKAASAVIAAVTTATTAWGAATTTAVTAVGLASRAAMVANPLLAALAAAITLAATAWATYQLWAGKSVEKTEQLGSTNAKALLQRLEEEETRLLRVNEARSKGISLMELEAQITVEKARSEVSPEVATARKALAEFDAREASNRNLSKAPDGQRVQYAWEGGKAQGPNAKISERAKLVEQVTKAEQAHGDVLLRTERTMERIRSLQAEGAKAERERMKREQAEIAAGVGGGPSGGRKGASAADKAQKEADKQRKADFMERRKQWLAAHDEQMKLEEAQRAIIQKNTDEYERNQDREIQATWKTVEAAQYELDIRGKTKVQIAELGLARLQAAKTEQMLSATSLDDLKVIEAKIEAQQKLITIFREGEILDVNEKAAKAAQEQWKQVSNSFVDNLMRGGKSVKEYLKDLFRTLVLRPLLQPVAAGIAGTMQSMMGSMFGGQQQAGGGSWMSMLGNMFGGGSGGGMNFGGSGIMNSVGSMFGGGEGLFMGGMNGTGMLGGIGAGLFGSAGAYAGGVAGLSAAGVGSQAAMLAAQTGTFGAAGLGATAAAGAGAVGAGGAAAGAGLAGTAMAAIPYIGWAIAIASLLSGSFKGETRKGGHYNWNGDRGIELGWKPSGGEVEGMSAATTATATSINAMLKDLGSDQQLTSFIAAGETSGKGRGGVLAGGVLSNGMRFGEDGSGSQYGGTYFEKHSTQSPDDATLAKNFAEDLKQATLQALQIADVPGILGDYIRSLGDVEQLTGGALDAAVNRITTALAQKKELEARLTALTTSEVEKLAAARQAELDAVDESNRELLKLIQNIESTAQAAGEAFNALQRAVDKERESIGKELERLNELGGLFRSTLDTMRGHETLGMDRATASGLLDTTLGRLRAGEKVKASDELRTALGIVSDGDNSSFSSFVEYAREFDRQAAKIAEMGGITDAQTKFQEDELQRLDNLLEAAQKQLDALAGINTSVLTLAQAEAQFASAIAAATGAKDAAKAYKDAQAAAAAARAASPKAQAAAAAAKAAALNPWGIGQVAVVGNDETGVNGFGNSSSTKVEDTSAVTKALNTSGGFAVGTNYVPFDMITAVHKGERIQPAWDNPYANPYTSDSGGSRAMDIFVVEQREANYELISTLKNLYRLFENWDANGMPAVDADWEAA
jgi:TP901 family phage tail tape measure protein